jgi:hypothetical protein
MSDSVYHVFTKPGDALHEVEAALASLKDRGVEREAAGMYKGMYVTRADQTVVMTESSASALAVELRARSGWSEPGDRPLAG